MPKLRRKQSSLGRNSKWGWWKKQWPWWRICLAAAFVVLFFVPVAAGIFPSELRTGIPSGYIGYWVMFSSVALALVLPLGIGPDWRHQGAFNTVLWTGLLAFWAIIFPENLVARIYVEQQMSPGRGVIITPTEFQLYSIEARYSRYGRSYVAKFRSANGLETWRPAAPDITEVELGDCVTLNVRRNSAGAVLVEGLNAIYAGSFRHCSF